MSDTIFSKIINKEIPATICYEDDEIIAFEDINPKAPVHTIIIPRRCIPTVTDATPDDAGLIGRMVLVANKIAAEKGISENGFRLVFNCREHGGQEVYHLHLHLLGGRPMQWGLG